MSIYKKLLEAKKEIGKISKDSKNPFFKSSYFDINSLLEHVEPVLQRHGLLLLQPIVNNHQQTIIIDVESAEKVISEIELTNITDPQKRGSEITYYRRYTAQSLLGLQAEDDDANSASKAGNNSAAKAEEPQKPWLNIYKNGTTELTDEMTKVSVKMKDGTYKNIVDIRKDYSVNKVNATTIEAWFIKLKKSA